MATITFGGHTLEFKVVGDEVYIKCKNVTGTLTQALAFRNKKKNSRLVYSFGEAKVKNVGKDLVQVGCLTDSKNKINEIINHCKNLRDE